MLNKTKKYDEQTNSKSEKTATDIPRIESKEKETEKKLIEFPPIFLMLIFLGSNSKHIM